MDLFKAFLRTVVAILVVVAGLLATVAMGAVAAVLFLIRRPRTSAGRGPRKHDRAIPRSAGEVIDVTATEVAVEPELRR